MSDDDGLDDFWRRLDEQQQRVVDVEVERMESRLASVTSPGACPMPLEWHPAYRDQTWLFDWLNERGPYGDRDDIRLPMPRPRATFWMSGDETAPTSVDMPPIRVLSRRRCAGFAPYVGDPFVYTWWAAQDELGRGIAGEARIQYTGMTRV